VPISPRREPNQQVQEVPPPKATQTLPSSPYLSSLALPISPLSLWLCLSLLSLSLSLAQPISPLSLSGSTNLSSLSPPFLFSHDGQVSHWRRVGAEQRRAAGAARVVGAGARSGRHWRAVLARFLLFPQRTFSSFLRVIPTRAHFPRVFPTLRQESRRLSQ
jgi:hypothetical protein